MIYWTIFGLYLSFFVGYIAGGTTKAPSSRSRLRVEVGQSQDNGRMLPHMMSARIVEGNEILHYERVDMRDDDWEEKLAEATAKMKQKTRALEAAMKIGNER